MRVGLVDVDSKISDFALQRASTYHRSRGDAVEITRHRLSRDEVRLSFELGTEGRWDLAYLSCVFTWNRPAADILARGLEARGVRVLTGGTGYDWGRPRGERARMPDEVDRCDPDYSLYPPTARVIKVGGRWVKERFDYAVGFCQRGCVRKCDFCDVPLSEGPMRDHRFRHPSEWVPDGMSRAMLLDNEFAVQPADVQRSVVRWFAEAGVRYQLTQGYDIREVAERPELAGILAENLPYDEEFGHRRVYSAWDYVGIEDAVRKGLPRLLAGGIPPNLITFYLLSGRPREKGHPVRGSAIPNECGYAIGGSSCEHCHSELRHRFDVLWGEFGVVPFVMPYNNRKDDHWLNAFSRYVNRGPASYRNHTFEDYLAYHPLALGKP